MFFSLLSISCDKEKAEVAPEVKEFFASEGTDVKEEIRNFLLAAHPNLNVANKTYTTISDKEPNEGAWLMEAAINVERYGRLDKDVIATKNYTIEVNNKVLPNGFIRMDATDILAKYNQLLSAIVSDEINQKVANLIDLQIVTINNGVTIIEVKVNFVYTIEPIVFNPETIILPPPPPASHCEYQYQTGVTYPANLTYDFSNHPIIASSNNVNYSNEIGTGSYAYNQTAKENGIYYGAGVPNNNTGITFNLANGTIDFTPYTNVILVTQNDIITNLGCATILQQAPYNDMLISENLFKFKSLTEEYENFLPNNIFNDINYRLVYGLLSDFQPTGYPSGSVPRRVDVQTLGYLHISNQ